MSRRGALAPPLWQAPPVTEERWSEVDRYVVERLVRPDAALDAALAATAETGWPVAAAVSPAQGKLLQLLARLVDARSILEIGTLAGYSTIWLARALPPGGRLVGLEAEPRHAALAQASVDAADLSDVVEIRVGPALETLPQLEREGARFDLVFIDADKRSHRQYLERSLVLTRPGGVIVADNVVRGGTLVDAASEEPADLGVRGLHELLAGLPEVSATTIQTVGSKGWDGFTLIYVGRSDLRSNARVER
jgi:predicted O-methyltransferase YrrM